MGDVKIKGVFLGQEIDLTICESESVPESPTAPVDEAPSEAPAADAEAPVETPADPAPPVTPVDEDAPKNPAGNSEQL